jgi:hypothetical protein
MSRLRSITAQSPAIVVSVLALVFALGSGASYAATRDPGASPQKAARVTFHRLKLIDGWHSSQGQYSTGNPSYAEQNGIVYLSGSLHAASGSNVEFAVLPKGDRPSHYLYITVYTLDVTAGAIEIEPNGQMLALGSETTGYTSLATVSFPANS